MSVRPIVTMLCTPRPIPHVMSIAASVDELNLARRHGCRTGIQVPRAVPSNVCIGIATKEWFAALIAVKQLKNSRAACTHQTRHTVERANSSCAMSELRLHVWAAWIRTCPHPSDSPEEKVRAESHR